VSLGYFDTSALLKLFLAEPGAATARRAWQVVSAAAAGRLLHAEARAALAAAERAPRRAFTPTDHARARTDLDQVWERVVKVEPTEMVVRAAGDPAESYALGGYDAVHPACAMRAGADALVCADADLIRAAQACGLGVIDARR
jgi:predicted nucleic acid-binding protein